METTKQTVAIPARVGWITGDKHGMFGLKGTAGVHGDCGWAIFDVNADDVAAFMMRNAAASMPCWKRFEGGKVVR